MSDYIKATNFTAKDTLTTGDPGKIVKGSEIDAEYVAIASAISSKVDSNDASLTGVPTAPTAASGTNSTQVATTAFVKTATDNTLQTVYPVGSIYMNAAVATNPSTLLGFGTWVVFGAGRVLVGRDIGDNDFNTVEETGGTKDATVVSHTHSVTDSGHTHTFDGENQVASGYSPGGLILAGSGGTTDLAFTGISINSTGSSATGKNLQPYIVVYMWKRTA
jgi:hypothetical protein